MREQNDALGEIAISTSEHRSVFQAIKRGLFNTCPQCGKGKLFRKYVKAVDDCANCGEELGHIRADDIPPYFTITIVGHIVVPLVLWTEQAWAPPLLTHIAIWPALTLALTLAMLQNVKGGVIGLLWALRMWDHEKRQP